MKKEVRRGGGGGGGGGEGGEGRPECLEKTPDDELQKKTHSKTPKFRLQLKLEPATLALMVAKESRHAR